MRLQAVGGSLAGRTREGEKSFCCVTTRRRNLWTFNGLGCSLGPLTALAFCLGMPDFGLGILAVFGLPPAPPATGGLGGDIPAPGSIAGSNAAAGTHGHTLCAGSAVDAVGVFWPGIEAFAYRGECPREARSPKGNARGECDSILLGQFQDANKMITRQTKVFGAKKTKKKTNLRASLGRRRED